MQKLAKHALEQTHNCSPVCVSSIVAKQGSDTFLNIEQMKVNDNNCVVPILLLLLDLKQKKQILNIIFGSCIPV